MLDEFKLLGLDENATPEDIQLSFAYLYQMIDLIYPLEKEDDVRKERNEEFKKLEIAYLSALKNIRTEVIISSNSNYPKKSNTLSELNEIERLLNQKKSNSSQQDINIGSKINKIRYPIFLLNGKYHKILELSESKISITPTISCSYGSTLKGELKFNRRTSLKIIGKIVRKEEDRVITKLVTRIAKKWIKDFKTQKTY